MRIFELAVRNLKETYRDPLALGFLLGFPLVFMLLFGAIFSGDSSASYPVGVIDNDSSSLSKTFITEVLGTVETLDIQEYDTDSLARESLKLGDLYAFIEIPAGFGQQVTSIWNGLSGNITLDMTYDESDIQTAGQLISVITAVTRSFARIEIPVDINANPIHIENDIDYTDFMGPGIIVFGILIMIPTSARIIVRDKEKGFLSRLLTTPVRPADFILSYSLCLALIAVIQIILFMVLANLLGMDMVGNAFLAFFVFFLTALCSIGIGMIVGSVSKSENQAEPLCWLFSMPLAMLSGCWFSIEMLPSYLRNIASVFPYIHTIEAARGVITRGVGLEAIGTDFLFLALWAVGAFMIGIILFGRTMRT
ncbi:MAG: ABC transporter permease [Dehalococcoidales bacterium]|nr:ABC transporter permease [Dehalococcoidales bacterium]